MIGNDEMVGRQREIHIEVRLRLTMWQGLMFQRIRSIISVLRPIGEVVTKPFSVVHTSSELKELVDYLKRLDGETTVVMELSGRCYEPVASVLYEECIFVSAVNPKIIKDSENNPLHKMTTDRADARKIARYGVVNWRA